MNSYKRLFGSGPICLLTGFILFFIAYYLKIVFHAPQIFIDQKILRLAIFTILTSITIIISIWIFTSLSLESRGRTLITTGAFKYFRHPLYAAFITFFSFGSAILLNNWIFILWAFLLHFIGHLLVAREEKMLKEIFPNDYEDYCKNTGRFIPRLIIKRQ